MTSTERVARAELVERLRHADQHSVQSTLGSRIFGEAANEIERLTAIDEERDALREALYEALAEVMESPDLDLVIGGNPIVVGRTLERARTALAKAREALARSLSSVSREGN